LLDLADGDKLLGRCHLPDRAPFGCLIAVHGLNGSIDAPHILWLLHAALRAGFAVLRVNMRGAGAGRPLARGTYNAAAGRDLVPFIDWAADRFSRLPLFMMGHSLGGTAALNMALDANCASGTSQLAGLITVGAPLDMALTAHRFHARRNWLYMRYMLSGLKRLVAAAPGMDRDLIKLANRARTVMEFDDRVTAPLSGYASAAAYYAASSVNTRLESLQLPTLILQASNDPWIPVQPLLMQRVGDTRPQAVITRGGGHVGFHDRLGSWYIRAALAWINTLVSPQAGRIT